MDDEQWIKNNIRLKRNTKNRIINEIDGKHETIPTDAAGTIAFKGAARRTKANFVRLSDDTEADTAYHLLKTIWKLETPRLLVSVTGGAKSFNLQPKLKDVFAKGLLKVAQTPGAWVITGGTNTGVMKHVGTALKGATNACIGIATWGIIQNAGDLTGFGSTPYENKIPYKVFSSMVNGGAYLDHNHTHFLLVDDGSIKEYGREIKFRAKLEKHIMQKENVPCVLLVLQGGIGTLKTIHHSVASGEQPVPVVIIKGSGGVADCIAHAIDTITGDVDSFYGSIHKGIYENIKDTCYVKDTATITERTEIYNNSYQKVIDCVKQQHLITVFRIGSGSSVDEAILTALHTKTNNKDISKGGIDAANFFSQLKLCILWNRPDLAQEKLFPYVAQIKDFNFIHFNHAMIMALALDRVEFVRILLEYDVIIFLSKEILEFLYGYRSKIKSCLKSSFKKSDYKTYNKDNETQKLFQLLCSYENIDSKNVSVEIESIDALANHFTKICNGQFVQLTGRFNDNNNFQNPNKDLFFWAILNNMRDMALCFWQYEKEGMLKALVAGYLSTNLANQPGVPEKLQNALNQTAKVFNDLAVQLLDECSITNEELTEQLIVYQSKQFKKQTCLKLAVESEHLEYVSHSSVQCVLNKRWTGNKFHQQTKWSIIAAVLSPFRLKKSRKKELKSAGIGDTYGTYDDQNAMVRNTCCHVTMTSPRSSQGDPLLTDATTRPCTYTIEWHRTPIIKFYKNVVAYFIFLMIFSYVAMLDKHGQKPYPAEYVSLLFVISLLFEEINQFQSDRWWSNYWNRLDAAAIILSLIAFTLHYFYPTYSEGHLIYAMAAGLWILRLLNIFQANRILGPYTVMIYRMFIDMMYFLAILCVFLVAYGVSVKAILHPQTSGLDMLRDMVFQPYFNIYGELFLADAATNITTRFGTPITNSYAEPIAWVLLGIYLLIANVLLLNLLIAIFNNTFNDVQENSEQIWNYKRYFLIMEYKDRPPLVPPFILLCHIYLVCKWIKSKIQYLYKKCCLKTKEENSWNKVKVKDDYLIIKEKLMTFEAKCMASLMRKRSPVKQDEQAEKFQELLDQKQKTDHRLKELEDKIDKKFEEFENRIMEKICQK